MPAIKEKVEGFKLSKGQLAFTKNFKKRAQVMKLIQGQFIAKAGEVKRLGQLLDSMGEQMKTALRFAPKEPTIELEGQEPPSEGGRQQGSQL